MRNFRAFAPRALFVIAIAIGLPACERLGPFITMSDQAEDSSAVPERAARRGDVLVVGGASAVSITPSGFTFKGDNRAELFSPAAKTFAATDALTSARGGIEAIGFARGARAHQVLVPGGATGRGSLNKTNGNMVVNANALRTSEMYRASRFRPGPAMRGDRAFYTATMLRNGTVLVTGGFNGKTPLRTAEIYNPATNKFAPTRSLMTAARAMHSATLLPKGQVLIVGGITNGQGDTSNRAEIYNPKTRRFTAISDRMAQGVAGHTATLIKGCCASMNGRVVIAGGFSGNGTAAQGAFESTVTTITIYDPPSKQFLTVNPLGLNQHRAFHTATMFGGKIHFTGGVFGTTQFGSGDFLQFAGGGLRQSVEVYDPQLGTVDCVGGQVGGNCKNAMKSPRGGHTATLFGSGPLKNKVLLIGGHPNRSTEIYNPANGTFVAAGRLKTARAFHAAVIVP
jgi:hypothetical protein